MQLKTAAMPLAAPVLPVIAAWHRRHDADRAHAWLRSQTQDIVARLLAANEA
jgi:hypothetical protein